MWSKFWAKLKSISPKAWFRIAFALVCLILLLVISLYKNSKINSLYDQNAAKDWVKDSKSGSQVSAFIYFGTKVDDNMINDIRYYCATELAKVMDTTQYDETEDPLDGPFTYAYSGTGTVDLVTSLIEGDSYKDISAIGVGGDFFLFHPVSLAVGRYFDSSDADADSIILDSYTANRLFGSYDCLDAEILIKNIPHYVRGVYDPSEDSFYQNGGGKNGYIFVPYKTLDKLGKSNGISSIELVAENPVDNYLYNLIMDDQHNCLTKETYEIVDNTNRFGIPHLISVISDYGVRSMKSVPVIYPYWENVARGYEDIFGILLIMQTLLWTILAIMLIAYLAYMFKKYPIHMDKFKNKLYGLTDGARQRIVARNRAKAKEHAISKKEKSKWKDF